MGTKLYDEAQKVADEVRSLENKNKLCVSSLRSAHKLLRQVSKIMVAYIQGEINDRELLELMDRLKWDIDEYLHS